MVRLNFWLFLRKTKHTLTPGPMRFLSYFSHACLHEAMAQARSSAVDVQPPVCRLHPQKMFTWVGSMAMNRLGWCQCLVVYIAFGLTAALGALALGQGRAWLSGLACVFIHKLCHCRRPLIVDWRSAISLQLERQAGRQACRKVGKQAGWGGAARQAGTHAGLLGNAW